MINPSTAHDIKQRKDFQFIANWVSNNSRVLDLGCGDGTLLRMLAEQKNATGYGLELDAASIPRCIDNKVNVIQMNLDKGLTEFDDCSFDFVMLSLTLQSVKHPEKLLEEMLRVGKIGIVSFPNFGHWRVRTQLMFGGKMPVLKSLPHRWYNTPNIHLCSVRDFEQYCQENGINILESVVLDDERENSKLANLHPNLFGNIAMFRVAKK